MGIHELLAQRQSTTENVVEMRRGKEANALLTYHYLCVMNGVFGDGYPVSALLPLGRPAERISDSYCQLHSAASVPSICCYNIATNACCLRNEEDRGHLEIILYKSRDCN